MIETDVFLGEPTGLPQEAFGADVVETCPDTALDHFIEAKNAAMGPVLNAPGLAMLYAEDAVLEAEMPGPEGTMQETVARGHDSIQRFYEELSQKILAIHTVETGRLIDGRKAIWTGSVHGVHRPSRTPIELDARFDLEFDEHDHVTRQHARFTLRGPLPEA